MADVKRIALNTIGAPKKDKKSKSASKTIRFTLTLGESNEKTCPEFNYKELLAGEDRRGALKKTAAHGKDGPHQNGGGVSLMDVEDEDEAGMRAIARKFEEKYGSGTEAGPPAKSGKRKKGKNENYVDLGAGYDENDSFIDNTDAYDEIVPEDMTTPQGGFYINCGAIEYKQVEMPEVISDGEDTVRGRKKAKRAIISSDESSSDDDDEDAEDEEEDSQDEVRVEDTKSQTSQAKSSQPQSKPQPAPPKPQPAPPKPQSVAPKPPQSVPSKPQPTLPKSQPTTSQPKPDVPQSKPLPVQPVLTSQQQQPTETKKLKRPADTANNAGPSKKKSATVKDLLKEKRDLPETKEMTAAAVASIPVPHAKVSATPNSIADSIESVINAVWLMDDSKITSNSKPTPEVALPAVATAPTTPQISVRPEASLKTTPAASSPTSSIRLPDILPEDVRSLAQSLRNAAKIAGGVHSKFFTASVNKNLIRLEQKTQNMSSRSQIFAYVAEKIVCNPDSLIRKARKLARDKARNKEPLVKLKAAIDQLSPAVIEVYSEECQKFNESRFADGKPGDQWGKISPPSQIFPWTHELRTLLGEAVGPVVRTGNENAVLACLENQVRPLWPSGWMTLNILQQELQTALRLAEKPPKAVVPPPAPATPPQRSTSVITLAESPRLAERTTSTPTPPKPAHQSHAPISLKQRILQDASGGAFEPTVLAAATKQEDEIGLLWHGKSERPSPPRASSSDSSKQLGTHSPSPSSVDKLQIPVPSKSSKSSKDRSDSKKSNSSKSQSVKTDVVKERVSKSETSKSSKSVANLKKKWANVDVEEIKEVSVPQPTQEEEAKMMEEKNKMTEEETAAATDFLSQIIHQSLSGFPNASNFAANVTETLTHPPPKVENSTRHFTEMESHIEEIPSPRELKNDDIIIERKHSLSESNSPPGRASSKHIAEPPAIDPEVSVQLEMKRVMQELMELNGQMNAVSEPPKVSPVFDRVKGKSEQRESPVRSLSSPDRPIISPGVSITPMDRPRSRVDKARSMSGSSSQFNNSQISSNNTDLIITPSSAYSSTHSHQSQHALLDKSGRNSSGVSVIAVNSGATAAAAAASRSTPHAVSSSVFGFQEEFQRHLMQEPEVVYVSSSPPSAFRPNPSQPVSSLGHIPYSSFGQQISQQHQLHSAANEELRNSLFNYSQLQGSLQQVLSNHRVRHYPEPHQQPK